MSAAPPAAKPSALEQLCVLLARRRWWLAGGWFLLLAACVLRLLSVPMGNVLTELKGATNTEAYQVQQIMETELGYRPDSTAALVIKPGAKGLPPAAGEALKSQLQQHFPIVSITDLPGRKDPSLRCYFLFFDTSLPFAQTQLLIPKIRRWLDDPEQKLGIKTHLTGNAAFYNDFLETSKQEASLSELLALVFAFGVLIFTFGGLVGALLPLLMGITTLLLFNGFLNLFRIQVTPVSMLLTSILGLALSIDYAFFLVSRYQEEWDADPNPARALARSLKATGKTVAVSGLLVVLSTAALMLPDLSVQRTNAFNLVCVAAVATLNSLLFLPGLLLLTGPVLGWPALLSRRFRNPRKVAFWQGFARHVVKRPKRYFALSLALLLGLAAPVTGMRLWDPVQTMAPPQSESMQGYDLLQKDGWGGILIPIHVIVSAKDGGPVSSHEALGQLYDLSRALAAHPGVAAVQGPLSSADDVGKAEAIGAWRQLQAASALTGTPLPPVTLLNLQQREMMDILTSYALIDFVRAEAPKYSALKIQAGGVVARTNDFIRELYAHTPQVLSLVVISILIVLMLYMRSLVLPLKASLMNFLPILSAYGVLVLIFQHGMLTGLLHLPHHGAIVNLVPMTLFCLIFGLSMDYEILIMSRITEVYEACGDVEEAIVEGLARSSSVITGAALILIMVFVPGLFSQSAIMKEISLGIIAALVLDATIVRLLLVPSFMMLMGKWNWWRPGRREPGSEAEMRQ